MVVSTIKQDALASSKLLLVRRTTANGDFIGEPFVAIDTVGSGEDELVLVAIGSAARENERTRGAPVDAAIVGIIDSTSGGGKLSFSKSGPVQSGPTRKAR
jgi:ethanolamine utilization protein EutN